LRDDFLSTPLQFLRGVGPRKAADLKRAGLVSIEDLLYRLPVRYEDRAHMQPIASLRPGAKAAVLGDIKSAVLSVTRRRGFKIFNAVVGDASGAIRCTWMNQPFLADILQPHLRVVIFGDVKLDSTGLHLFNPEYELVTDDLSNVRTARVVPFYEKTGSVTPNMQRTLTRAALDQLEPDIPDLLPADLLARRRLMPRRGRICACRSRIALIAPKSRYLRKTKGRAIASSAAIHSAWAFSPLLRTRALIQA
jgi:ATP-dependent DNA helicase RecG